MRRDETPPASVLTYTSLSPAVIQRALRVAAVADVEIPT
jgi:hypothetical protein